MDSTSDTITATADPPPAGVPNPIHDADGADSAGYAGALVAGVRTYGWTVATITRALGDSWLINGWVDFSLKRPLYAGEQLTIRVDREEGQWTVRCVAGNDDSRVVLDGVAGLGNASWLNTLEVPEGREPDPEPELEHKPGSAPPTLPSYDLEHVPLHRPLNPLREHVSSAASRLMVSEDLQMDDQRYLADQSPALIHPFYLAARMAPLTRHNFSYGPTIHVRSQIQHLGEARADQAFTVAAQIVDAYDRRDHWYQVLDGAVSDQARDLALIRHHTIFRPRGTAGTS